MKRIIYRLIFPFVASVVSWLTLGLGWMRGIRISEPLGERKGRMIKVDDFGKHKM